MSTDHTCRDQISRLIGAGMSVGLTTMYRDVDTMQDAHLVAHEAPGSRFALELGRTLAPDGWPAADDAYEAALLEGDPLHFSVADGRRVDLDISRWRSEPDEADLTLLSRCRGATLDIGCGPGRLTAELGKQGRPSLGVDVTPTAVDLTRAAGGTAICRSVFDELPGEGAWDTVLLADGNLGISGDPNRLLTRVRELLRPGGVLLIEPVPIDADEIVPVRLSNGSTIAGPPFLWAHIGPDAAHRRVLSAGFVHTESWTAADRCFMAFTKS